VAAVILDPAPCLPLSGRPERPIGLEDHAALGVGAADLSAAWPSAMFDLLCDRARPLSAAPTHVARGESRLHGISRIRAGITARVSARRPSPARERQRRRGRPGELAADSDAERQQSAPVVQDRAARLAGAPQLGGRAVELGRLGPAEGGSIRIGPTAAYRPRPTGNEDWARHRRMEPNLIVQLQAGAACRRSGTGSQGSRPPPRQGRRLGFPPADPFALRGAALAHTIVGRVLKQPGLLRIGSVARRTRPPDLTTPSPRSQCRLESPELPRSKRQDSQNPHLRVDEPSSGSGAEGHARGLSLRM
jgi:hypothetical protein